MALMVFALARYYGLNRIVAIIAAAGFSYYCLILHYRPTATNISNDLASYPLWAAAFYYLTRRMKFDDIKSFQKMVIFTGLTIMVKTNAIILGAIIGSCVIAALATKKIH